MTDLLTPRSRGTRATEVSGVTARPLALGAAIAGLVAAGSVLLGCMVVGLAGWFASDAGAHGDTRDAIRIGADAWLLAHGAHLELSAATVTAVPLGLTLVCGYVTFRLGRWAGLTSAPEAEQGVLLAGAVLAGVYAVVATVTAVLASTESASPDLWRAFVGGFVLATATGGVGLLVGAGQWASWRQRLPEPVRAAGTVATSVVLLMLAAAALLVTVALLLDLGAAANVLSRLHTGAAGGMLYTVVVAAVAPNSVLFGAAYLLGPGFSVGTGTLVSPSVVVLGPVPAFPLVAALPDDGATPTWTVALVGVPVLAAAVGTVLALRRYPVPRYLVGVMRGLAGGVVAGVVLTASALLAGGAVGPGRMADVGVVAGETALAAVLALGAGGVLGGLAATWRVRRTAGADD